MDGSHSIQRSINHWVRALSLFGTSVNELTVASGTVFELTDDFFDGVGGDVLPNETEWFQIDAQRYEIFLDDDVSTMRLANRLVSDDLQGDGDHPLVHWFGYNSKAYDLEVHVADEKAGGAALDTHRVCWIGWDYRIWRTYLFDGARLIPITQTGAVTAGLEVDVNRITWMGWDGEHLDVFTSEFPQMPPSTAAVMAGADDNVIAVHARTR
jgi:hypothetical protein